MAIVSVITPTRNRDLTIVKRSIGSIQIQTITDWEHIICSEGEEEAGVLALVNEVNDSRLRYRCTNEVLQNYGNMVREKMSKWEANGKYIYFFDDDNICFPWFLEKMVDALESAGADIAVSPALYFHGAYKIGYKQPKVMSGSPIVSGNIDAVQVVVRREAILQTGWDTMVGYCSDGVTLEHIADNFKCVRVEEVMSVHL